MPPKAKKQKVDEPQILQKCKHCIHCNPKKRKPLEPDSAEFYGNKGYRKGFKADRYYARQHKAYMFVKRGPFKWTKIHFAVWRNDLRAVEKFVEFHQTEKPEVLLQTGQWGETALHLALRMQRSPEMIKELLRGNGKDAVNMKLEEYYFKDIDQMICDGLCYYPIHEAVNYEKQSDAFEVTKLLIKNGADVNAGDYNDIRPVSMAAMHGHHKVITLLLENDAEPPKVNECSVFHCAVNSKKTDKVVIKCLQSLFSKDPTIVNWKDERYEKTALHTACENMKAKAAKFLLTSGADPSAKNKKGRTPLDVVGKECWPKLDEEKRKEANRMFKSIFKSHAAGTLKVNLPSSDSEDSDFDDDTDGSDYSYNYVNTDDSTDKDSDEGNEDSDERDSDDEDQGVVNSCYSH